MPETLSTALGILPIRQAVAADAPALTELLQNTQRWLDEHHIQQWVPVAHEPLLVKAMIQQGNTYVVEHKGQVIAICRLLDIFPGYWQRDPKTASYLSTLTVAREFAAQGIGAALVSWAEATLRKRGKAWACLDCYAQNPALSAYYERLGYIAVGEVEAYPGYFERMFEKPLRNG